MTATKKSISFDIDTVTALERRGSLNLSGQVQTIVHAWTDACRIGLKTVRRSLTATEAQLILDTMNGSVMLMPGMSIEHWITGGVAMTSDRADAQEIKIYSGIEHNVSDAIALDHLDEKWEIDGPALINKLRTFDRLANLSLLDWCQVMWDNSATPDFWSAELEKFKK